MLTEPIRGPLRRDQLSAPTPPPVREPLPWDPLFVTTPPGPSITREYYEHE